MSRKFLAIAALFGTMMLAVSCNGDDGGSSASLPGTSVAVLADGSLAEDPPPLSLRDVRRQGAGSAAEAVMRLWFLAQWGNIPAVVAQYDPVIRRELGVELLSGGYASQRPVLLASRPRVAYSTPTELGMSVGVDVYRRGAPPLRDSFLLRKSDAGWRVVYDTVLERAFTSYVQFSLNPDQPSAKPSRTAIEAGQASAARFRSAYIKVRDGESGAQPPGRGAATQP